MASKLTCQSCSSTFEDPRILSCLHSFCLKCISKMQNADTIRPSSVTCATCHLSTPLPKGGVESLQCNVHLIDSVHKNDIIHKITSHTPPPLCGSCEEESSPSIAYCTVCDNSLCTYCTNVHKRIKTFRSHLLIRFEEVQSMDAEKLAEAITPAVMHDGCPSHDAKLLFYCNCCVIPICPECVISSHKGHSVDEVCNKATEVKSTLFQHHNSWFSDMQKKLKNGLKVGDDIGVKIEANKSQAHRTIQDAFAKLRKIVDTQERYLLKESDQIAFSKETALSVRMEELKYLLATLSHCHAFISAAAEYKNIQLLSIAETVCKRSSFLQQTFADLSVEFCVTPDVSVEVNTDTLTTMIKEFGCVSEKPLSSNDSIGPFSKVAVATGIKAKGKTDRGLAVRKYVCKDITNICNGQGPPISPIPKRESIPRPSIAPNSQVYPFLIDVGPSIRDYTNLKYPLKIIDIMGPRCISFSDSGDMFVSASSLNYSQICVFDCIGHKKTVASSTSLKLQLSSPWGVAVSGEVVYVADNSECWIEKLTRGGESLGVLELEELFVSFFDVKIGPEGDLYASYDGRNVIEVFDSDLSRFHAFDVADDTPCGMAFDNSCCLHVCGQTNSMISVYSPQGHFLHTYGKPHLNGPTGIAIDPLGYSLVVNRGSLSIFDPKGKFVHSVDGLKNPCGVAVSSQGLVWVADTGNNRLLMY